MKRKLDLQQMGRNIRELRCHRNMTQTELARQIRCSPQHLSWLENGVRSMSVELFMRLCHTLECRPSDILARAE